MYRIVKEYEVSYEVYKIFMFDYKNYELIFQKSDQIFHANF